ncbi:hypothetical protein FB451DRAFT_1395564 [Mycena latifolia]|nr:hypothetical protein FB451DRAFT_1395564 [Mycena latifolia]
MLQTPERCSPVTHPRRFPEGKRDHFARTHGDERWRSATVTPIHITSLIAVDGLLDVGCWTLVRTGFMRTAASQPLCTVRLLAFPELPVAAHVDAVISLSPLSSRVATRLLPLRAAQLSFRPPGTPLRSAYSPAQRLDCRVAVCYPGAAPCMPAAPGLLSFVLSFLRPSIYLPHSALAG